MEADFAFTRDVGMAFLEAYAAIVRRRMGAPVLWRQRTWPFSSSAQL